MIFFCAVGVNLPVTKMCCAPAAASSALVAPCLWANSIGGGEVLPYKGWPAVHKSPRTSGVIECQLVRNMARVGHGQSPAVGFFVGFAVEKSGVYVAARDCRNRQVGGDRRSVCREVFPACLQGTCDKWRL